MPRITFDVDDNFYANLNDLVKKTSATSKGEVFRNALAVYRFLKNSVPPSDAFGNQVIDVPGPEGAKVKMLIP